ncbi:MAG: PQQ-dependent sugar dehydrogenase [Rhodobacterales bacterium]|nr:PQQ-dependent sugar dehydrogenase [Rhodobacterales bacterium]
MYHVRARAFALSLSLLALLLSACAAPPARAELERLRLPDGYAIETWAKVPGARSLVVVPDLGAVLVSSRGDAIHAVRFDAATGRAGAVVPLKRGLKVPNGIAWKDGALYVAEQHRIVRFPGTRVETLAAARPQVLFDALPDDRWHGWRDAAFGPDGWLYVAVGAPCNICLPRGLEGTLIRLDPNGGAPQVFARGIRNSVGLAFHPETGALFFTDNGADNMGDDSPPDELNRAETAGLHFGYPWFGGGTDRTPDFAGDTPPAGARPPVVAFGAHVAALGVHHYRGAMFPAEMRTDALVAQHGSWNRSVPDGYRVVRVHMDPDGTVRGYAPFIEGWLGPDGRAFGRPVDLAELPDGSLLISDDRAGVLYRVTYRAP